MADVEQRHREAAIDALAVALKQDAPSGIHTVAQALADAEQRGAESAKAEAQSLEVGSAEYWQNRFSKCLAMLTEAQAKAEAQPAGTGWVSVEERLPEDAFTRLVFATFRTVAYYEDGSWWRTGGLGAERFEGVTHWMPLPPPPEPRE